MNKPVVSIEVVSDVVCPWCYIGKRRLEKAVAQLSDTFDFDIRYSPFQLNPHMPMEGADQKAYLTKKFGSAERYSQITQHVTEVASEEGLDFNFEKQKVSPNTFDAHRTIWYARHEGKQEAAKEAMMKAYFEEGIDLSKKENLIAVAVRVGLSKEKVTSLLQSDQGRKEVTEAEQLNHQRGVSGVPFYIINGQYGISGAQSPETFMNAFRQLAKPVQADSNACAIDDPAC